MEMWSDGRWNDVYVRLRCVLTSSIAGEVPGARSLGLRKCFQLEGSTTVACSLFIVEIGVGGVDRLMETEYIRG